MFLTYKLLLHKNLDIFSQERLFNFHKLWKIYHLAIALGNVFATKPGDEFQSNRLVLAGDAAPIDKKRMDTDIKRFVEVHKKSLIKM